MVNFGYKSLFLLNAGLQIVENQTTYTNEVQYALIIRSKSFQMS